MTANRPVKADVTMFSIIDLLGKRDGAGVTEIADEIGMSKASVHHHLSTMLDYGYVSNEGGKYYLGLEFFRTGINARNRYIIYHAAKQELRDLADRVQEAVWSFVEANGKGMFIDGNAEHSAFDLDSVIGSWRHLHCCAIGKVILAYLPERRVTEIVKMHGLPRMTENTITDENELRQELEVIRDQGYALNLREDIKGIHAVGVAVLDDSELIGALGTGGPANRLDSDYCKNELVEELLTSANEIELNLAYG